MSCFKESLNIKTNIEKGGIIFRIKVETKDYLRFA